MNIRTDKIQQYLYILLTFFYTFILVDTFSINNLFIYGLALFTLFLLLVAAKLYIYKKLAVIFERLKYNLIVQKIILILVFAVTYGILNNIFKVPDFNFLFLTIFTLSDVFFQRKLIK